jgi:hypothetical protein
MANENNVQKRYQEELTRYKEQVEKQKRKAKKKVA